MQDGLSSPAPEKIVSEGPVNRRGILTQSLAGMVSAIVASQARSGMITSQPPEYIDALAKVEATSAVATVADTDLGDLEKGRTTPKLVSRILARVIGRISGKRLTTV